ncbi:MAG: bifunctional adenosylcobinamide kinase/adenosylcobinamide-phosphate guanylyltransferase [Desulfobulbaceae bacterium]|nr:bifunctional adenosylcobinamide kinase/adenosylcobinamide-phosphate guanylyltransferase [Desulfobulbaceae bacterium]
MTTAKGNLNGPPPRSLLVLGGCRSGKSAYAESWAAERFARKLLVATLAASDDAEMAARVALHRARRDQSWGTVEEPLHLAAALRSHQGETDVFLVDCLTMWITNCLLAGLSDPAIEQEVKGLASTVNALACPVVLVANEVGLGLVPENALGRRFRDLAGWANQQLAANCQQVVLVAAGLPLILKP